MTSIRSLAGLVLVLGFVHSSVQLPLQDERSARSESEDSLLELPDMKRHSEGTFSNDYSKFLQDQQAQDFVRWLMNNKRSGVEEKRHADGTFTSDVSSFLRQQAAKDFVDKLKAGQVRRASAAAAPGRRHVDGSFTSDVNKVLDSMAAKEYLLWVMTSKPAADRRKRRAAQ